MLPRSEQRGSRSAPGRQTAAPCGRAVMMRSSPLSLRRSFAGAAVAAAIAGAAVARLGQLAIRADTGLRHAAPEQAVTGAWDGGIRLRPDVLALPMQRGAQPRTICIEAIRYVAHAAPPSWPLRSMAAWAGAPAAARM